MAKRLQKTTKKQYEELLNFVNNNKVILSAKPHESKHIITLWETFANYINGKGYGPEKTPEQWRNVFSEWKANIKRKCKLIQSSSISKQLTELEEQLLSLISKINLGDNLVKDSLLFNEDYTEMQCLIIASDVSNEFSMPEEGSSIELKPIILSNESNEFGLPDERNPIEASHVLNEISIPEVSSPIDVKPIVMEPAEQEEMQSEEPIAVHQPIPRKKILRNSPSRQNRYTHSLLKSACKKYLKAQEINVKNQELQMEVFKKLNEGIYNMAVELKKKNSINLLKLKLEYFKIHHTYDGFDKFIG